MLTTDANIVDVGFQVVWNVSDPARYLFNIAEPQETVVGGVRIGDARGDRGVEPRPDPEPRPRHHRRSGA